MRNEAHSHGNEAPCRIAVQQEEFTHVPMFFHVDFGDGFPFPSEKVVGVFNNAF